MRLDILENAHKCHSKHIDTIDLGIFLTEIVEIAFRTCRTTFCTYFFLSEKLTIQKAHMYETYETAQFPENQS